MYAPSHRIRSNVAECSRRVHCLMARCWRACELKKSSVTGTYKVLVCVRRNVCAFWTFQKFIMRYLCLCMCLCPCACSAINVTVLRIRFIHIAMYNQWNMPLYVERKREFINVDKMLLYWLLLCMCYVCQIEWLRCGCVPGTGKAPGMEVVLWCKQWKRDGATATTTSVV